jgi:predicted SAM-dependent methyltransferase
MLEGLNNRTEGNVASETKQFIEGIIQILVSIIKRIRHLAKHHLSKIHIKRLLQEQREIYLEVGAGKKKGENGWITIDVTKICDIYWDLRKGIPFPNESISKIYSSHFFEHLSFKEGQKFLDECLRVLVPGGTFSICVPNSKIYIEAYFKSCSLDKNYFNWKPAYNNTTKIDYVNYIAYMNGQHKYMFDEENLIYILQSKGFKNARLREFEPNLDLKNRDINSIYAEAEK